MTKTTTETPTLDYLGNGLSVTMGYLFEQFKIKDFNLNGFTDVPTGSSGEYGHLPPMGTLPANYSVSTVHTKLSYSF